MTTSRQQAARNIAAQIDSIRLWAAGHSPQLAQAINNAIATELSNQSAGFAPSKRLNTGFNGFGDGTDDLSSLFTDDITTVSPDLSGNGLQDLGSLTSYVPNTDVSGLDLSGLSSLFSSAGSGATPLLSSTGIASNPTSVSGILNGISNTFSTTIKDIYEPQETLAIAQGQLASIQAQSQAAQLGLTEQAAQAKSFNNLLTIGAIGIGAIFLLKTIAGMNDKTATTTTTNRRNY